MATEEEENKQLEATLTGLYDKLVGDTLLEKKYTVAARKVEKRVEINTKASMKKEKKKPKKKTVDDCVFEAKWDNGAEFAKTIAFDYEKRADLGSVDVKALLEEKGGKIINIPLQKGNNFELILKVSHNGKKGIALTAGFLSGTHPGETETKYSTASIIGTVDQHTFSFIDVLFGPSRFIVPLCIEVN